MTKFQMRAVITAAVLAIAAPAVAQQPPDSQGLIREREESRERLRQEQIERNQRELLDREQAERAARQRLESGRIERMQPPQISLPGNPPLTTTVPQPGITDRAAELRRDEAAKRDQRDYDSAVRARRDAERGTGSTIGLPEPWKPTGAR
ncbi:MAG TPA: hypothetical protein VHM01_19035 [Alphaproteobacteria bacterium]|nr:hypothetical protein [Alphaproteobacteria bacterium]